MDGTVPPLPFQLPPLSSSRPKQLGRCSSGIAGRKVSLGGFFVGFRVRMQPQTINAPTIAQKIQSCICCIVVFSSRLTPPSHYKAFRVSSVAQQPRQLHHVGRNPPCVLATRTTFSSQGKPQGQNRMPGLILHHHHQSQIILVAALFSQLSDCVLGIRKSRHVPAGSSSTRSRLCIAKKYHGIERPMLCAHHSP
jgi:hypothetical protein